MRGSLSSNSEHASLKANLPSCSARSRQAAWSSGIRQSRVSRGWVANSVRAHHTEGGSLRTFPCQGESMSAETLESTGIKTQFHCCKGLMHQMERYGQAPCFCRLPLVPQTKEARAWLMRSQGFREVGGRPVAGTKYDEEAPALLQREMCL